MTSGKRGWGNGVSIGQRIGWPGVNRLSDMLALAGTCCWPAGQPLQGCQIRSESGSYCPKLDKSGTFSDHISVYFDTLSQNVLKSDLKKSRNCPIWGQSDPLSTQICWPSHYVNLTTNITTARLHGYQSGIEILPILLIMRTNKTDQTLITMKSNLRYVLSNRP